MTTTPLLLLLAAAGANGPLAGASLDQSIKQLPARHRIGVLAFARYSQAAQEGGSDGQPPQQPHHRRRPAA